MNTTAKRVQALRWMEQWDALATARLRAGDKQGAERAAEQARVWAERAGV